MRKSLRYFHLRFVYQGIMDNRILTLFMPKISKPNKQIDKYLIVF